jgi:hypothetical protein
VPENRLRDFDNSSRRKRQALLKKGPGVFVYDGKATKQEWSPTPLRTTGKDPAIGDDGMPLSDADGNVIFEKPGQLVPDGKGGFRLGGKPKIKLVPILVRVVQGVSFPAGDAVAVSSPALALKLRGMDGFEELEGKAAKDALAKAQAKAEAGASAQGQ